MSEPYIIQVKDFDPEKQERQSFTDFDDDWTDAHMVPSFCQTKPIVVRDKPKPKTLDEVVMGVLMDSEFTDGRAAIHERLTRDLREAFPELKDK